MAHPGTVSLLHKSRNSRNFSAHRPCSFLRQAGAGGGDQLLALSQLYFLQASSSGVPASQTLLGTLPHPMHLPVKFRVRAKLQKRLVIKVDLLAGTEGIFGLIRQLFNYQVSHLEVSPRTPDGEAWVQTVTPRLLFRNRPSNFGI